MSTVVPFVAGRHSASSQAADCTARNQGEVVAMPHIDMQTVLEMLRCFRKLEERSILKPVSGRGDPRERATTSGRG